MLSHRPNGPFDPADPLSFEELSGRQRVWRMVIHLLAERGGELFIPHRYAPEPVELAIVQGWLYLVDIRQVEGGVKLTVTFRADHTTT